MDLLICNTGACYITSADSPVTPVYYCVIHGTFSILKLVCRIQRIITSYTLLIQKDKKNRTAMILKQERISSLNLKSCTTLNWALKRKTVNIPGALHCITCYIKTNWY